MDKVSLAANVAPSRLMLLPLFKAMLPWPDVPLAKSSLVTAVCLIEPWSLALTLNDSRGQSR
jgi:hypothetical protein